MTKQLLINAICGAGFKSIEIAQKMESAKMAAFVGNQHCEAWEWRRSTLEKLDIEDLKIVYGCLTNAYTG